MSGRSNSATDSVQIWFNNSNKKSQAWDGMGIDGSDDEDGVIKKSSREGE